MPTSTKCIFLLFLCTALLACTSNIAGQISPKELEEKVDAMLGGPSTQTAPGTAVVVIKDGDIWLNKGYGLAVMEQEIPITPASVFDLASVSKQFTGFAVSSLVEQGRIDLQDDIRKYLPELPDFGHIITIDQLVHHISGIRDWTSTLPLAGWSFDDVISFDQILRMAQHQKTLNFVPGSEYVYSNTGYNLLAELVQRVTGQTFREWTNTHIFRPLGMDHTFFLDDHTEMIPNRVTGYYLNQIGAYHAAPNLLTALGSSSLYSTTSDLARWAVNLDRPRKDMESIIERMFTKGKLNSGEEITYAFGLTVSEVNGTKWIAHGGSWASFRTYLAYLPEHRLSVIVLKNQPANTYQIALDIASLFVPDLEPAANAPEQADDKQPVSVSEKVLDEYVGTYRLGPGWYVTISRRDDQLWTQATNEDSYPMTTRSDSLFWIRDYGGRTMTFVRDAQGQVTHVKYNNQLHPRVEPADPREPKDYQAYAGEYVSEELNTSYTVVIEDNALKMKHFRHGTLEFTPAWKDDFAGSRWFISSVEFQRDAYDKVTGFKVWQYRARDQVFTKVR